MALSCLLGGGVGVVTGLRLSHYFDALIALEHVKVAAVVRGNTTNSSPSCHGWHLTITCRNTGCSSQPLSHCCTFG
jgi:hypothetical protein